MFASFIDLLLSTVDARPNQTRLIRRMCLWLIIKTIFCPHDFLGPRSGLNLKLCV